MKLVMKRMLLLLCGLAILGLVVLGVSLLGRVGQPNQAQAELQAALSSGQPVLVAFYSKNCEYCKADEPVLKQLQQDFDGVLITVRIDVGTDFGQQLARQVGVRGVPAYFLIDTLTGETLYEQVGPLQVDQLLAALAQREANE